MISLIKYIFRSVGNTDEQQLKQTFEEQQRYFDEQLELENRRIACENAMTELPNTNNATLDTIDETKCYKHTGVITTLHSDHGTIDNSIFFEMNVALAVCAELSIGCRVDYLAFQEEKTEHIKVVSIMNIVDQSWDKKVLTKQDLEKEINVLRKEKPTFFYTQQRNILGLITERKNDCLLIDTDYKILSVEIDKVTMDVKHIEGDRVCMVCTVQADEQFVDKQGEILEVISIKPARIMMDEKRRLIRKESDWGVLNEDTYYTNDVVPAGCMMEPNDIVTCDVIECERRNFYWRAINIKTYQRYRIEPEMKGGKVSTPPTNENSYSNAVSVSEYKLCILSSTTETKDFEISITNNRQRIIKVLGVKVSGKERLSQLELVYPPIDSPFNIPASSTFKLQFQVKPYSLGETLESILINFEKFRIKRTVKLIICDSEKDALEAAVMEEQQPLVDGYQKRKLQVRSYANQIWSKTGTVISGVHIHPKPRFIKRRIGQFDVPIRLRESYLMNESYFVRNQKIETMYPVLAEQLNATNYAYRFQTLLFLEEVEYFVNFRTYDRERAHFTRDGEYLSLAVENLAERRPSLVIGDVVYAINPWTNEEIKDQPRYQGIIHKVLFDRILLKFAPIFQNKYNGEDYRLEFYFSRFPFRKQHYAVQRVLSHMGEHFLFPSKIKKHEKNQLDAELDAEENLLVDHQPVKWYNSSINNVQKRAICNILRGEVDNMPYVIFGPPGTGKTITVVETILQLMQNIPGSRILVGTPSNSSADLICTRLIESGALKPGEFIRLVSQNQIEKEVIPDHLKPYCATCDFATEGTSANNMITTESGLTLRCQMKYLGNHRIIVGTCSILGNFIMLGFPPHHFTHVLIDECGQCKETEILVPIILMSRKRGQVILAGDPHQLHPLTVNSFAGERGLSLSFLERVLQRAPYSKDTQRFPDTNGYDPRLITKLLYNYRSLPSLLNVYSNLFYDSELIPMISADDSREAKMLASVCKIFPNAKQRSASHGFFFYGIRGQNKQENDSPSWYNPVEAKHVFMMVINLYRHGIEPENIGIITPYMKQLKHIRGLFTTADILMPKIGTVEEFQGQERDIILISTVRSVKQLVCSDIRYTLGFVHCSKRLNVAISRARCLNITFGNPHLLVIDDCWRALIKYCIENEAYYGCDLPEALEENE